MRSTNKFCDLLQQKKMGFCIGTIRYASESLINRWDAF